MKFRFPTNEIAKKRKSLHQALEKYIASHYEGEKRAEHKDWAVKGIRAFLCANVSESYEEPIIMAQDCCDVGNYFFEENESALQERIHHMSDTFQEYLFYLIEQKGLTNAQVYTDAYISKQTFSKIKQNKDYHPEKTTALQLCIGAKLNIDETKDLLARAGYAISPCDLRDIIIAFFIEHEMYDMTEIEIALEEHGVPCFV